MVEEEAGEVAARSFRWRNTKPCWAQILTETNLNPHRKRTVCFSCFVIALLENFALQIVVDAGADAGADAGMLLAAAAATVAAAVVGLVAAVAEKSTDAMPRGLEPAKTMRRKKRI